MNIQHYQLLTRLSGHQGPINCLDFTQDGEYLASGGDDEKVRIWRIRDQLCIQALCDLGMRWGQITCIRWQGMFSGVNSRLIFGTGRGLLLVYEYNARSASYIEASTTAPFSESDGIEALAYDSLHQRLGISSHHGRVHMYTMKTNGTLEKIWGYGGPTVSIRALIFHNKYQTLLAFATETGSLTFFDAETGRAAATRVLKSAIGSAAMCPNEKYFLVDNVTAGFDLYEVNRTSPVQRFSTPKAQRYVTDGVFGESGTMVIGGSDHGMVYVIPIASPKKTEVLSHVPWYGEREKTLVQTVQAASSKRYHYIASASSGPRYDICLWAKPISQKGENARKEKFSCVGLLLLLNCALLLYLVVMNGIHFKSVPSLTGWVGDLVGGRRGPGTISYRYAGAGVSTYHDNAEDAEDDDDDDDEKFWAGFMERTGIRIPGVRIMGGEVTEAATELEGAHVIGAKRSNDGGKPRGSVSDSKVFDSKENLRLETTALQLDDTWVPPRAPRVVSGNPKTRPAQLISIGLGRDKFAWETAVGVDHHVVALDALMLTADGVLSFPPYVHPTLLVFQRVVVVCPSTLPAAIVLTLNSNEVLYNGDGGWKAQVKSYLAQRFLGTPETLMPPCYCTVRQCQGAVRDHRTVRSHGILDATTPQKHTHRSAPCPTGAEAHDEFGNLNRILKGLRLDSPVASPAKIQASTNSSDFHSEIQVYQGPCLDSGPDPGLGYANNQATLSQLASVKSRVSHLLQSAEDFSPSGYPLTAGSKRTLKDLVNAYDSVLADLKRSAAQSLSSTDVHKLQLNLQGVLHKLNLIQESHKAAKSSGQGRAHSYSTEHHFDGVLPGADPILQVALFSVAACSTVLSLPRRGADFLLGMSYYTLQLSLMRVKPSLGPSEKKLLSDFPQDSRSVLNHFHLEGKSTRYAVCPSPRCHKMYPPTNAEDPDAPIEYPTRCEHREFPGQSPCGTVLIDDAQAPIKPFVYFHFKDWLAGLLSRPGFEDMMDKAWERTRCDSLPQMHDVFDGTMLRSFLGPDGGHFGSAAQEGRYVFGLFVDFFNPLGNKQAGKKISTGVISLVCFNLPPEQRYKPENMYLAGVIPGPNEPPLTTTNHYLTPLIDELLELWETGAFFTRTYRNPQGRQIHCALVALICDLLAARKIAGFSPCTHNFFCSVCSCTRRTHGYGNTQYGSWEYRTNEECRRWASQYLAAPDEHTRKQVFDSAGIRWSELLRLPYFDPSQFVVIDVMHNLFLGLLKEHFDNILGARVQKIEDDTVYTFSLPDEWQQFAPGDRRSVARLKRYLQKHVENDNATCVKWAKCSKKAIKFICDQLKVTYDEKATNAQLAKRLLEWRTTQTESPENMARQGAVIGDAELQEIWSDIAQMSTPSWTTSVPSDLGTSRHGKLKADQWRMLGTTYLPITLIRLWSRIEDGNPRSVRCHKILQATMSLVSAVIIATSRTTSVPSADAYFQHMHNYIEAIHQLFPDYKFHPNHHMALHVHDYLRKYGPAHGWWCFPFERIIGILQRIPNNGKPGEYEETIGQSYTQMVNLRAVMHKSGSAALHNCEPIFNKLVESQVRGTLNTNTSATPLSPEPDISGRSHEPTWRSLVFPKDLKAAYRDAFAVTPPEKAHFCSSYTLSGITFSVMTKHEGNSQVLLPRKSPNTTPHPALITHIFKRDTHCYLAVRRYLPFPGSTPDPFKLYPVLRAGLHSAKLGKLEIVDFNKALSQFARCPLQWDNRGAIVTISLSHTL